MPSRISTLAFVVLSFLMIASAGPAVGQTETTIYGFKYASDGAEPQSRLIFDKAGNLYGTAPLAGNTNSICNFGCGTVYELSPASGGGWTLQTLYEFAGGSDGYDPVGGLTLDSKGNLYGTTQSGGTVDSNCTLGCGTVFELSPASGGAWTYKLLHSFDGTDGAQPRGILTLHKAGDLYGTTVAGVNGAGAGTIFKLSRASGGDWTFATLYTFTSLSDGFGPYSGVILDTSGNLYGTASGSKPGYGTVFELSPVGGSWTFKLLHTFEGTSSGDGAVPFGGLVRDKVGNLYGTTSEGGRVCSCGTVFSLSLSGTIWKERVLHSFDYQDGQAPMDGLTMDAAGSLYGTTMDGGTVCSNCGTVFELTLQKGVGWSFGSLYSFTAGNDGYHPEAGVTPDALGNIYGTASAGGPLGYGDVFELVP